MKKTFISFLMVFILLGNICVYASDFAGVYEGWYYANQGQTGLTLTVEEDGTGVFEFYSMPGNSNSQSGKYTTKLTEENGQIIISGDKWINQPSTYNFVTLKGAYSDGVYFGKVDGNSSWDFVLNKNNDKYQNIADSVFNNHKYELIDEGLSWSEAKALCEEKGGYLAVITSREENDYITGLVKKGSKNGYWLGGEVIDGELCWITNEKVGYTNWDVDQPDNSNSAENKLMMFNGNNVNVDNSIMYSWNDLGNGGDNYTYHTSKMGYVCEWNSWSEAAKWSTPALQKAAENNLIPDVLVGKDMTAPITRGEFAAVAVNLFEAMTNGRAVMSSECNFDDIAYNENRNYILKAYNIGAVAGYDENTFGPDDLLQREQLAAMLCRVYKRSAWPEWTIATDNEYTLNYSGISKFDDDALISNYAKPSVYFLVKNNVLSGVGNNKFAPKNSTPEEDAILYANATREQAIVMSLKSFENLEIQGK
ncbi:MAG: C-type lectin domain-containing protein [Clostridia bacterium]|nr:C-type lectin domain-containing protein [Clostridia bacterium]